MSNTHCDMQSTIVCLFSPAVKFVIPWAEMTRLERVSTGLMTEAIRVSTRQRQREFSMFLNRDEAFGVIGQLADIALRRLLDSEGLELDRVLQQPTRITKRSVKSNHGFGELWQPQQMARLIYPYTNSKRELLRAVWALAAFSLQHSRPLMVWAECDRRFQRDTVPLNLVAERRVWGRESLKLLDHLTSTSEETYQQLKSGLT